jgi:hypothetical protein
MDEMIDVTLFAESKFCVTDECDVIAYKDGRDSDQCPGCGRVGVRVDNIDIKDRVKTAPEIGIGSDEERFDPMGRCGVRKEHGVCRLLCFYTGTTKCIRDNDREEAGQPGLEPRIRTVRGGDYL